MPIAVVAISLVVLLAFPLAGRTRGVHACLGMAAIAWIVSLSQMMLGSDFLLSVFSMATGPEAQGTHFVVIHIQYQLSVAAGMALLGLLAWLARPVRRLALAGFWIGHIALVAAFLLPLVAPVATQGPLTAVPRALGGVAALGFLSVAWIVVMGLAARVRGSR